MFRRLAVSRILLVALAALAPLPAAAATIHVAVAANFTAPAKRIAALFEKATGDSVSLSFGSTGQLFTQIDHGAPFAVFLAADRARPEKAVEQGLAVEGSRFTYAVGQIALYSTEPGRVTGRDSLTDPLPARLAIANPDLAPYGAAAVEAMKKLGVYGRLRDRIVQGENIAQAYQFVATGNAEIGFVALSQIAGNEKGSRWIVPNDLYSPIRQDAVLLEGARNDETARAFLDFLKSGDARAVIAKYGYATQN